MTFTKRDYRRIETLEKQIRDIQDRLPPRRLNPQQSSTPIGHRWPYVVYQLASGLVVSEVQYQATGTNPVIAGSEIDAGVEVVEVSSGSGVYNRWDFWGRGVRRVTLFAAFNLTNNRFVSGTAYAEFFRRWYFEHRLTTLLFMKQIGRNRHSDFVAFDGITGSFPFTEGVFGSSGTQNHICAQWLVANNATTDAKQNGFTLSTLNECQRFSLDGNGQFDASLQNLSTNAVQSSPEPLLIIERLDTETIRTTSRKLEMESVGGPPPV